MKKFYARRPMVKAMQYDGENAEAIAQWMHTDGVSEVLWPQRSILVPTEAGSVRARKLDWVVQFYNGTFRVMDEAEFNFSYEPE
jgi:hypothetical protein